MRTLRHNGEHWYEDHRPFWMRILQWIVTFGGWQRYSPKQGTYRLWRFRWDHAPHRLRDPFPLSLFGHRVTFYSFGVSIRLRRTRFNWSYRRKPGYMHGPLGKGYAYLSRDGTPHNADHWLWGFEQWHGWPEVRREMQQRAQRLAKFEAERAVRRAA